MGFRQSRGMVYMESSAFHSGQFSDFGFSLELLYKFGVKRKSTMSHLIDSLNRIIALLHGYTFTTHSFFIAI
jgi:hypothetical protein